MLVMKNNKTKKIGLVSKDKVGRVGTIDFEPYVSVKYCHQINYLLLALIKMVFWSNISQRGREKLGR